MLSQITPNTEAAAEINTVEAVSVKTPLLRCLPWYLFPPGSAGIIEVHRNIMHLAGRSVDFYTDVIDNP